MSSTGTGKSRILPKKPSDTGIATIIQNMRDKFWVVTDSLNETGSNLYVSQNRIEQVCH
jgi:hypothetical protein